MSGVGDPVLVVGAVAYDPRVVTIWEGFRAWFADRGLDTDYVLYSNYERQVEDLMAGRIHVAWNSPLAWVRARRLAEAEGRTVEAIVMRDTDQDLSSVVVVRSADGIDAPAALAGRVVGVGAVDSPQATLLPLAALEAEGLDLAAVTVRTFDVLGGKHGDHVGGERLAAAALVAGEVDAACMIAGNHAAFLAEGVLSAAETTVMLTTAPYDHCNFTVTDAAPRAAVERLRELLLGMDPSDPEVDRLFALEGLRAWCPARVDGYRALERAVDRAGFYDADGRITASAYRY